MKRLGLIGGSSWISTVEYYRHINLMVNARLGGSEYALLTIDSLNFGDVTRNFSLHDSSGCEKLVVDAAMRLAASDATAILICANTLHLYAKAVETATGLPVIHVAKATARAVHEKGIHKVALLGTKKTMEMDIYFSILADLGIECITPSDGDRHMIDHSIFNELGKGIFTGEKKAEYLKVIEKLQDKGAEGVILGCTEIPLLLAPEEIPIPSFDTTKIHSTAAVDYMLRIKA